MPTYEFDQDVVERARALLQRSPRYKVRQRSQFVLLLAKGYTHEMISDIIEVSAKTTFDWKKILREGGLETLATLNYKGQPSKLHSYGEQLEFEFMKNPVSTFKEARHIIAELTGILLSLPQIREFMLRNKFKRRKVGQIPAKTDIAEQGKFKKNKLDRLVKLAVNHRIRLFFVDAAHFVHQPFLGYLYSIKRVFIRAAAGRKRFNVLGALDAVTKNLTVVCNEAYINSSSVLQLLELLGKQYVGEKIYVILDNARYQRCRLVQEKAKMLGIHLIFLPPYSPNFNLIERLWRFVKSEVLYNEFYSTFCEFKMAIESCLQKVKRMQYQKELETLLTLKFQTFEYSQTNP